MATTNSMNRIRFNPSVQVVEVMRIDDYTPCEITAAWYSDEQMEKITKRCSKIIKSMDAGRGRKYCVRGLEGHSNLGSISKKRNRSTAMVAVLNEQSEQWIENTVDEQAIADAYRRTTSSCQLWAQVKGNQDRQAADAVLYKVEDEEGECMDEMQMESPPTALKERIVNKLEECTFPSTFSSSKTIHPRTRIARRQGVVDTVKRLSPSSRAVRLVAVS